MPGFELFGEREKAGVQEVLESGVLMRYGFEGKRNGHWKSRELEKELALRMGVKHAHLVSSGTAALTVALASAGIGAGDEVLIPTFTFVASFEAVLALGAIPVLIDIDDTLTMDPRAAENAITSKTRAVMPVHMCGSMGELGALKKLCAQYGLLLLEDACQAIGGSYEGKPLGACGDIGCFSFDYVKTVTCGEGGALITDVSQFYENAHKYSDHGHDHLGNDRGGEDHPFLGYNFRISELNAAVGLAQLGRLEEFLGIQEKHYRILQNTLETIPDITFRRIPDGGVQNYSFLSFFLPDQKTADKAHSTMLREGAEGCFYWYDNNWHYHKKWDHLKNLIALPRLGFEMYGGMPRYGDDHFSASDRWMGRTLSCLIKLGWNAGEAEQHAERIKKLILKSF